jgi:uncharacterized membrane protein
MENSEQLPNNNVLNTTDNGKTVALLSYITIIGWIVALVMNSSNKTALGAYHLRQTILLFLTALVIYVLQIFLLFIPFIGWLISFLLIFAGLGLFVLWIIGLIAAVNGEMKPMPLLGKKAQEWFKGIGN